MDGGGTSSWMNEVDTVGNNVLRAASGTKAADEARNPSREGLRVRGHETKHMSVNIFYPLILSFSLREKEPMVWL
jgi:hypothetical protein